MLLSDMVPCLPHQSWLSFIWDITLSHLMSVAFLSHILAIGWWHGHSPRILDRDRGSCSSPYCSGQVGQGQGALVWPLLMAVSTMWAHRYKHVQGGIKNVGTLSLHTCFLIAWALGIFLLGLGAFYPSHNPWVEQAIKHWGPLARSGM